MLMITLYAKHKKRHRFIEQSLDSVGEGEGGMFQENTLLLITKSLVAQSFSCQLSGNKTAHLQTVWVKTTVILLSFSLLGSTGKFICCSAAIGWGWNHLKYPDDSHICHLGRAAGRLSCLGTSRQTGLAPQIVPGPLPFYMEPPRALLHWGAGFLMWRPRTPQSRSCQCLSLGSELARGHFFCVHWL